MKFSIDSSDPTKFEGDALIVSCFEGCSSPLFGLLNKQLSGQAARMIEKGSFKAKTGEALSLTPMGKTRQERIVFLGLGKMRDFALDDYRKSLGSVIASLKKAGCKKIGVASLETVNGFDNAKLVAETALASCYDFNKYKKEKNGSELGEVVLFSREKNAFKGLEVGKIIGEAANLSRDLANEPGNIATPIFLAEQAKRITRENGLSCTVMDEGDLKKLGMNAFLGVAQGSKQPPRLIVMEYKPKGAKKTIALVGKGVTFDSGGISIKPGADMDKMKFDKSGACSVIALMKAIVELKLPFHVVALAGCTENLPSGTAYKPGDLIQSAGKSIEVLNTDAEGRMVLLDVINYACEKYSPEVLVDVATLTGAIVVSLGSASCGLFCNDDVLSKKFFDAGLKSGEKAWPMPLWKDYDENVKGVVGDLKNIGDPRGYGGASNAAAFLKSFVKEGVKWVHLDVAGTAWLDSPKPFMQAGATGAGVRLILQYLLNESGG